MIRIPALCLASLGVACGSSASGIGDLGNVRYELDSDHVAEGDLRDVAIVAGHVQHARAALTERGERRLRTPARARHQISAADGSARSPRNGASLRHAVVTVPTAGDYTLRTRLDGAVFDRIALSFETPTRVALQTWVKGPDAEAFNERNAGRVPVEIGAQAAILPIPMHKQDRLAGSDSLVLTAEPANR